MNKAQDGDTVKVTFEGVLEDGSVFDSSSDEEPLTFIIGENEVVPGLERAVVGMGVGEQKSVKVPPEDGYGIHQERLVEVVNLDVLPENLDLRVGNQLEVTSENGSRFRLLIIESDDDSVTLDANHPLAGRTLTFHIELVSLERPTLN